MPLTIEGTLHAVFNEQQIKPTLRKREFVLVYAENPSYPQYLKFDLFNDKCSVIDGFTPGDKMEVSFNLRGREWVNQRGEKVYINSMEAWRINRPLAKDAAPAKPAASNPNTAETEISLTDDLPF